MKAFSFLSPNILKDLFFPSTSKRLTSSLNYWPTAHTPESNSSILVLLQYKYDPKISFKCSHIQPITHEIFTEYQIDMRVNMA